MSIPLVYSYESFCSEHLERSAEELKISITSFRYFGNTNPIIIKSNDDGILKYVRHIRNVTFQKTDFASYRQQWSFLPTRRDLLHRSYCKLFVIEMLRGMEYFHSDLDVIFFNQLKEYPFSKNTIQCYQGFTGWVVSGFMHVPANPSFIMEEAKKVDTKKIYLVNGNTCNFGDELFFNRTGLAERIYPYENLLLFPQEVPGLEDFKKPYRAQPYLGIHPVHRNSFRSSRIERAKFSEIQSFFKEYYVQ